MAILNIPNDFLTWQDAYNAAANGDIVEVEQNTYSDTLSLAGKTVIFVGLNTPKFTGTINCIDAGGLAVVGFLCGNSANLYTASAKTFANGIKFKNCIVENTNATPTGNGANGVQFENCSIRNLTVSFSKPRLWSDCIGSFKNCDLTYVTDLITYVSRGGSNYFLDNCKLKNCDIAIFGANPQLTDIEGYDSLRSYGESSVLSGCRMKYISDENINTTDWPLIAYQPINSIPDVNSKIATDATAQGNPAIVIDDDLFLFRPVELDYFLFPTSETESQIKLRTVGANKYGTSAVVANNDYTPNANFTLTSNYLTRNTASAATLELTVPIVDAARLIRRIELQFGNSNPANDESFSLTYQYRKSDGALSPETAFQTGLIDTGGSVYDFDYIEEVAREIIIKVEVFGTSFGNLMILGASVEFYDFESFLPQTARTENTQTGTGAGYFIGAPSQVKIPETLRQFFANTTKEDYTFAELETEAATGSGAVSLVYRDAPTNAAISEIRVQTDSKIVTIYTFIK